jgi:homoserine dehydrogenase
MRSVARQRRPLRLALLGFGAVGRRFVELLRGPYGRTLRAAGVEPYVTGIATARHDSRIAAEGLPLGRCLRAVREGRSLAVVEAGQAVASAAELIRKVPADVLIELTPLDPRAGEPAVSHIRAGLLRRLHVVTANKGPVAFALRSLRRLSRRQGVELLFEGAVMDGTPVFNLVRRCLPAVTILGFRGVLNSTTTRILSRVEQGKTPAAALREAQAAGVTEADPSYDLEGWDAAVKGCALANALMGACVSPRQVRRTGIGAFTPAQVRAAARAGRRVRLVVRGSRLKDGVKVEVAPEALRAGDLLVSSGSDGVLVLETDLMGEIGIWEGAGGVDQTAYALLSDLVTIVAGAGFAR